MKYPISQLDFQRDFSGFVALSQSIYGTRAVTNKEMYQWLFAENIYNPRGIHLLHIARDKERVIASDGLIPVPLCIAGKRYLAAWSVKTMTHPDYQRQGIFRAMTEYSLARARELGIQLVLGFANSNSYPGYAKFGWHSLLERRAVIRPLDIKAHLAKYLLARPLAAMGNNLFQRIDDRRIAALAKEAGSVETAILSAAPPATQEIWDEMKDSFAVLVQRDYPYFHWRYNLRPGQDYKFVVALEGDKPVAMLIFRTTSRGACFIVDYLGPAKSRQLPALVLATIKYCRSKGLRHILNSSGRVFDTCLRKFAFKPLKNALANNMFIACPLADIDLSPLRREDNWFFSYGDSELDIDLQPGS